MRWPPMSVWPLVGQANSSLLPFLLSLPAQKPEQRAPRDPNNARQTASLSSARTDSGWTSTAGPAEAGRLALWRKSVAPLAVRVPRWALRLALLPFKPRPCAAHSRPEVRRARPPRPDTTGARPSSRTVKTPIVSLDRRLLGSATRTARLLQSQQAGARPRVPGSEADKPRAPDRLRFVRDCHEGCKPGRGTTGRYIQCSTNAPAPADAGPPVAAALYITPVVPLALSGLSR